jgi:hypothetical protein
MSAEGARIGCRRFWQSRNRAAKVSYVGMNKLARNWILTNSNGPAASTTGTLYPEAHIMNNSTTELLE